MRSCSEQLEESQSVKLHPTPSQAAQQHPVNDAVVAWLVLPVLSGAETGAGVACEAATARPYSVAMTSGANGGGVIRGGVIGGGVAA